MNIYLKIKELANEHHISISELERTLNLSNGTISKWGKSMPNTKYLIPIANYFNVSTDYLLGRTDNRNVDKTSVDIEDALNSAMSFDGKPLSEHDKNIMRNLLKAYLKNKD
ncbi:MAG TPA: helix-turn-helix domain-containing protein [Candidatus Ligilactobacillus excrementigallinarum]|uniref:Helix-turn-helix domain-containing protein n=1 Tax=Candidatus Ligilactobacillus excrementigallinarum TaxID=2838641 RepID=A0A9D2A9F2_9LACO|nr:helix-turn-helix domain-containing protein [Candidatus Ligilactobacillus excrementigallinarum]